jgi:hypothetical protein
MDNILRKYSINANNLYKDEIKKMRVDRKEELDNIMHFMTIVRENIMLIGERGIGKTFLTRLCEIHIEENMPHVFPVRIDLTTAATLINLPSIIIEQLCKETWIKLCKKDYSTLLEMSKNDNYSNILKKKGERRLIDIYRIIEKEQQKYKIELKSKIEASLGITSLGIKGESGDGEVLEWQKKPLRNFELLELIREIKENILSEYSKRQIIFICDEANKLREEEQYKILTEYLDFFGTNQFNFLLVLSDFKNILVEANKINMFVIQEIKGFSKVDYTKEIIEKSFYNIENTRIDDSIYSYLHDSFDGNIRLILDTFDYLVSHDKQEIKIEDVRAIVIEIKEKIRQEKMMSI